MGWSTHRGGSTHRLVGQLLPVLPATVGWTCSRHTLTERASCTVCDVFAAEAAVGTASRHAEAASAVATAIETVLIGTPSRYADQERIGGDLIRRAARPTTRGHTIGGEDRAGRLTERAVRSGRRLACLDLP